MHPYVNTAVDAARKAGRLIMRSFDNLETLQISAKSQNEFVTQVDHASENLIIETLRKAYPDHAFYGEESGRSGQANMIWIIDPLDGTTNFIHGFPQFSISIAAVYKGKPEHGVIYDPLKDELFTASRGQGAQLNHKRIRVSERHQINEALLGTGFPYDDMRFLEAYLNLFKTICPLAAGIRRAGSAALDLAYVAAGRLDGFWECNLKPWDVAAGSLLIKEAGGLCTDFASQHLDFSLAAHHILAGNPKLHQGLKELVKPYFTEAGLSIA